MAVGTMARGCSMSRLCGNVCHADHRLKLLLTGKYVEGKKPWGADTKYDIALPCATQNEIGKDDAEALVKSGVKLVAEGANMPTESAAIAVFHKHNIVYAPGKVSSIL